MSGKSGRVLARSDVRTAVDPKNRNLKAERELAELNQAYNPESPFVFDPTEFQAPRKFAPEELLGRHFFHPNPLTGIPERTEIVRRLQQAEDDTRAKIHSW